MNYAGTFDFSHFGDPQADATAGVDAIGGASSSGLSSSGHASPGHAPSIVVQDANLLFSGDYKRSGVDLVLSKDGHDHVVSDYFKGSTRASLSSPDGAQLSGDLVTALVGEVQVAQLGGGANAAAQVIGTVSKMTGSATAIRNGVSVMLNVGDQVQKGDVVQAGADSSLGLTFIDGTVFGLSANARMVLNEMVYDPNGSSNASLLSLVQGTITFVAGETAKNGNMRVDTPVATMGIRGTAVLVEIGFDVPAQGSAPPVKFQVLVEPDGKTGSYVLYSKTSGQIIGTVNQAGQVTSVLGNGDTTTGLADPLTPMAQAIIQQTLQQYFPSYVPNANPRSNGSGGGSTPSDPIPNQIDKLPNLKIDQPNIVPINLPGDDPGAPPTTVNVTVTPKNTAPTIAVASLAVIAVEGGTFKISDRVTITDPDIGGAPFNDVAVPYVAGSGRVVSATGPANTPTNLNLASLVTVDPVTGAVTYDPAAFKFLAAGAAAVFTIAFDSRSGPDTVHETLTFTVTGVNDAPLITSASLAVGQGGTTIIHLSDIGITDPDSSDFFYYAQATHGTFEKLVGTNWTPITGTDAVTAADIEAGHIRFHHDGSGVAPVISVVVSDGIDSSAAFNATIAFSDQYHLTSTAGTSIGISSFGATNGFVLPGTGNVTTPGTPEDRIVLGYDIGSQTPTHVVLNGAPMMSTTDFSPVSNTFVHNTDGSNLISTVLDAHNGVTLTQTVSLGANANFFTTNIDIFNNSTATVNNVRFMRNFDPDQDVDQYGNYTTYNDVVHAPANSSDVAIVSAKGMNSGKEVALIGLSGNWHGSVFGFTNTDPYVAGAYDTPSDPDGAAGDLSLTLTYNAGSIAAGQHANFTFITTANVATNGNNALFGTEGNDTINGLGGNDLLIGLGGTDNFVFTANSGKDTILDFQKGIDHIDLSAIVNTNDINGWMAAHVAASPLNSADTLITVDSNNTILLHNVDHFSLSASDLIVHNTLLV